MTNKRQSPTQRLIGKVAIITGGGGAMGGAEETVVKVRDHVAQRGFAVYPNFERGAQALARIVDFFSRGDG